MSENTKLSSTVTISQYKDMVKDNDREPIANFISERFTERYLTPFTDNSAKHGFSMMAISCLMIESLESFRQGWHNSNNKSALAFCYFFDRSAHFSDIRGFHQEFYKHIRCGLLHQAETTGSWKITRKGKSLFDCETKTIDATIFMDRLKKEIDDYVAELKRSEWQSPLWKNTRNKIKHIYNQCSV